MVSQFSNIEVIRKRCLTNKHALISPMHLNLEKLLVGSSRLVYESNLDSQFFPVVSWAHCPLLFNVLFLANQHRLWCGGRTVGGRRACIGQ